MYTHKEELQLRYDGRIPRKPEPVSIGRTLKIFEDICEAHERNVKSFYANRNKTEYDRRMAKYYIEALRISRDQLGGFYV